MHETETPLDNPTYMSTNSLENGGYAKLKIMGGEIHIHTSHFYVAFSTADWKRLAKAAKQLIKTHEKDNHNG